MTGWANVLLPYFKNEVEQLYANPFLDDGNNDWKLIDKQHWRERLGNPQGSAWVNSNCLALFPLTVALGNDRNRNAIGRWAAGRYARRNNENVEPVWMGHRL